MRKGLLTSLALGMLLFSMFSGNALAGEGAQEYRWVFAERERLLGLFENEGADAAPALAEALEAGENAFLHRTAAHLLVRLGEPALEGIEKSLEHGDFQVRRIAIDGLAEMGMLPRYWDRVAGDEHPSIRRYARVSLKDKHIGEEVENRGYRAIFAERERLLELFANEGANAAPALAEALQAGEDAFLHRTAAHLLVRLGEPALGGIEKALEHTDFQVRRIAIDGLAEMGMLPRYWHTVAGDEHPSIRRYAQLLRDRHIGEDVENRGYRAIFAERERLLELFANEGADAAPALAEALEAGENAFLHRTAAHLLVRLGEPALDGIEEALEHGDFQVRRIAIDGLAGMGMLPRYWDRVAGDEHPSIRRYARLVLRDKHIGGEGPDLVTDGFAVANPKGSPEVRLNVVKAVAETPARSPEAREMLVESTPKASEAHLLRGRAYYQLDEGEEADADPKAPALSRPETGGNASNRRKADVWPLKVADFRNNLRPFLDKFFNDF